VTLVALTPFPGMPHPDIGIAVDVTLSGGILELGYRITGDIGSLVLPVSEPPEQGDRLWEHSCFEAFLQAHGGAGYIEVNVAPSRRWAIYRFDSYRQGMRVDMPALPRIFDMAPEGRGLNLPREQGRELWVRLIPEPLDTPFRLGLSAVIEAVDGSKSYWALAHPPEKPDFHHPDCFVLELPAASRA
jgi:hypothetical protein